MMRRDFDLPDTFECTCNRPPDQCQCADETDRDYDDDERTGLRRIEMAEHAEYEAWLDNAFQVEEQKP